MLFWEQKLRKKEIRAHAVVVAAGQCFRALLRLPSYFVRERMKPKETKKLLMFSKMCAFQCQCRRRRFIFIRRKGKFVRKKPEKQIETIFSFPISCVRFANEEAS